MESLNSNPSRYCFLREHRTKMPDSFCRTHASQEVNITTVLYSTGLPLKEKGGQKEKVILESDTKFHNEEKGGQKEKIIIGRKGALWEGTQGSEELEL